jgi:hypothetical protein
MNDLAYLREQYKKLKDELSIARRMDWLRKGLYSRDEKKGGQLLNEGFKPVAATAGTATNLLSVELKRDGTVTITSPDKPAPAPAAPEKK